MTSIVTASDDMEDVPVVESGTAKDTQNIDQDLGEGEDLIEDTEAQPEIAGMDSKTFNKLMPTGRSLARIFEQAKREDEAPATYTYVFASAGKVPHLLKLRNIYLGDIFQCHPQITQIHWANKIDHSY